MNLNDLNASFAIPGSLSFNEGSGGLTRAQITTPTCTGELYLHGAHLTSWQPAGAQPVLFLSERSAFAEGKAIRGGVPIIFPWFGNRTATTSSERTDGPAHGFARTAQWEVAFAALAGNDLHLTLTLGPSDVSRELGYADFQLAFEVILGSELRMRLTVANRGNAPMHFEEALHTYLNVSDAEQISIDGLGGAHYVDKNDSLKCKAQVEPSLYLSSAMDSVYLDTTAPVTLTDPGLHRRITVRKRNSKATTLWNPWSVASAKMSDMTAENWRRMTCVETVNAMDCAITLAPGEAHTMEAHIAVGLLGAEISTGAPTE
jgi:glucose-6-phosphate 1-epimerase